MASDQTEATRERAQVQAYLQEHKVNDMLCNMLEAMCIHRPANPQQFVIDWMATQYPDSVNVGAGRAMGTVPAIKAHIDEDDPEAEEDDFETEPPPSDQSAPDMSVQMAMQMNRNKASRRRSAVSAESVDPTSIAKMYERKVHEKDPATRERLATKAQETFLFSTLDKEQLDVLLDAMFQVDHTAGSTIIKQGSEGDNFYIVYSGECDVFVRKGDTESHVLTCLEGDSFGELALLYNWPRAATVKAKTDTTLFAVDRTTFKYIMMDTTIKKRNTYEGFLEHVPLLSSLTKNERQTVADALKSVEYKDGEEIIHQGEVSAHGARPTRSRRRCARSVLTCALALPRLPLRRTRCAVGQHILHPGEGRGGVHLDGRRRGAGDRQVQARRLLW